MSGFAAQTVVQILDPDDARNGRAFPERPLVGKDQVDPFRAGGDDAGGSPEMPRVGPLIVIVKEAEIVPARLGGAIVQSIALPVSALGAHQRQQPHHAHPRLDQFAIARLMLHGGAVIDDDQLEIAEALRQDGLQRNREQGRAVSCWHDDRKHRPMIGTHHAAVGCGAAEIRLPSARASAAPAPWRMRAEAR